MSDRGFTEVIPEWGPPLKNGAPVGFFEFWPTWLMYFPVVLDWLRLSVSYRSLTLPLLANPNLPLAGMVGVAKSTLMSQARGQCERAILPWIRHIVDNEPISAQVKTCVAQAQLKGIQFPLVCKPDIGCRGAGVKLIADETQLQNVLAGYMSGTALLLQKLSSWEPEAGIFYVRDPATGKGEIVSLTFKFSPWVTGDGKRTVAELVAQDDRASSLAHLYKDRHAANWEQILPPGKPYRLVFSASHCRGAVFRDAREHITPELTESVQSMLNDLPGYNYGRLDVKFPNTAALRSGKAIEIIELNGASSESIHIWDRDARLMDAVKTLLWQYRTLFRLGAYQRALGLKPPGIGELLQHWRLERRLTKNYPKTD